jgi:hypothetical protein
MHHKLSTVPIGTSWPQSHHQLLFGRKRKTIEANSSVVDSVTEKKRVGKKRKHKQRSGLD